MINPDKDQETDSRDDLNKAARALSSFVHTSSTGNLDDVVIVAGYTAEGLQAARSTVVATLGPKALGGFGLMMGISAELEQLFPDGTSFTLSSRQDGSVATFYIGDLRSTPRVEAGASGLPTHEDKPMWAEAFPQDKSDETADAIAKLIDPNVIAAGAQLVVKMFERLQLPR